MVSDLINVSKYNFGLGLSGGGAKGVAHAGVIKALVEYGLEPNVISGVSAGAIVGALYADGKSPEDILAFFKETRILRYINITRPKLGLVSTQRYEKLLKENISASVFENLNIPLYVNATELAEGKNVYFSSGKLIDKVVASATVPIFFQPRVIDKKLYVDGGIFNNMPCSVIRDKCKLLAGCHLSPIQQDGKIDGVLDVAERVYELSIQSSTVLEKRLCDIVFEPINPKDFGLFDNSHADKLYNSGYDHAMKILEQHNSIIQLKLNT